MRPWASEYLIQKKFRIGGLCTKFEMRSSKGFMGRFGGGWDWKLGLQASTPSKRGCTVIVSLLVAELRFDYCPVECV